MEDIILLLVNDKRMKDILTYPVLIEVCDIIDKMYQLGWDERNGGNVSYLLDENELSEYLDLSKVIRTYSLNFDASELKENIIRNDKCYKDYLIVMSLLTIILFLVKIILNKNPFTSIIFLSLSVPILLPFIEYLPLLKSRMVLNKRGVLIKNINILEKIDSIDTIVLDKTRTITTGIPTINSINKHCDLDEREILEILVSIEKHSINNFSLGIKKYAEENFIKGNLDVITEELEGYVRGINIPNNLIVYKIVFPIIFLPIGFALCFFFDYGIRGLWIGIFLNILVYTFPNGVNVYNHYDLFFQR